jgi:hypothetical protein
VVAPTRNDSQFTSGSSRPNIVIQMGERRRRLSERGSSTRTRASSRAARTGRSQCRRSAGLAGMIKGVPIRRKGAVWPPYADRFGLPGRQTLQVRA